MAMTSRAKEAKPETNVKKKEPTVLLPKTDEVRNPPRNREHVSKLLPRDIQFCVNMIEKHGENYEVFFLSVIVELLRNFHNILFYQKLSLICYQNRLLVNLD